MCIHLLLLAGCDSIQSSRKLGSDLIVELENLRYMPDLKLGIGFWRKLLEENSIKPDNITTEETDAPVQIEDKTQDEKETEKVEVREEVEATMATPQKEAVKVEPAEATAHKEDMNRDEPKSDVIQNEILGEVNASEETKSEIVEEVKKMETQEVNGQAVTGGTPVQSQDLQKDQNNATGAEETVAKLLESIKETAAKLPQSVEEAATKLSENEGGTEEHEQQISLPQEDAQIEAGVAEENPVENTDLEEEKDISSAEAQAKKLEEQKEQDDVHWQKPETRARVTNSAESAGQAESDLIKILDSGVAKQNEDLIKMVDSGVSLVAAAVEDEKQDDVQGQKTETQAGVTTSGDAEQAESKEEDLIKMGENGVEESDDNQKTTQLDLDAKMDNDKEAMPEVKTNEEVQTATSEVETHLEELRRNSVIDPMDGQGQDRDPSTDDYDIMQELADLPTKFQETAGKVADHLRPDVLKWTDTSKVYFNLANQQITESFSPLIGKQYAPFLASMISYAMLLLPLIIVIMLFEHIRALLSLQKVLLFVNIYLAAYFATLCLASLIIGLEPMSFFYQNSLSSYLSLQLLQALGYVVYLVLQTANIINSCAFDTLIGKLTAVLQWIVALLIGFHYYVTVFHPAVRSKPPHTNWKIYSIYSAAFFILCLFARIRWVKKQYISSGNDITNKKS